MKIKKATRLKAAALAEKLFQRDQIALRTGGRLSGLYYATTAKRRK